MARIPERLRTVPSEFREAQHLDFGHAGTCHCEASLPRHPLTSSVSSRLVQRHRQRQRHDNRGPKVKTPLRVRTTCSAVRSRSCAAITDMVTSNADATRTWMQKTAPLKAPT